MNDIDVELERLPLSGDWKATVTILSRSSIAPETLEALMTTNAHDEIRIALAMRPDVTPEQLQWCAETSDNTFLLNRIVAHSKSSTGTLRQIRDRAMEREGHVWELLASYASRRIGSDMTL